MDQQRFLNALDALNQHSPHTGGIGELSEGKLHSVLKHFYGEQASHEIKLERYITDITSPQGVIEIQTRNLKKILPKITRILSASKLTLVHPIVVNKRIFSINSEEGTISKPRRSPKIQTIFHLFLELSSIRSCLMHPNFTLKVPLLQCDEYKRIITPVKSKITPPERIEVIPRHLICEYTFQSIQDYFNLLPHGIKEPFTSKDITTLLKIPTPIAQKMLLVFRHIGVVELIGKQSKSFLYIVHPQLKSSEKLDLN
jgi:hypothetical protein